MKLLNFSTNINVGGKEKEGESKSWLNASFVIKKLTYPFGVLFVTVFFA